MVTPSWSRKLGKDYNCEFHIKIVDQSTKFVASSHSTMPSPGKAEILTEPLHTSMMIRYYQNLHPVFDDKLVCVPNGNKNWWSYQQSLFNAWNSAKRRHRAFLPRSRIKWCWLHDRKLIQSAENYKSRNTEPTSSVTVPSKSLALNDNSRPKQCIPARDVINRSNMSVSSEIMRSIDQSERKPSLDHASDTHLSRSPNKAKELLRWQK